MSTSKSHLEIPLPHTQSFHHFPSLPTELRIRIWLFSFPPPSTKPLLRVSSTPSITTSPYPKLSYTFKLNTTAQLQATTSLEYIQLHPFVTASHESRILYCSHFNLTHSLPTINELEPIYYNPTNTIVFVDNGLFISSDKEIIHAFLSSSASSPASYKFPSFLSHIQQLALPASHLDKELMDTYQLNPDSDFIRSIPIHHRAGTWPPSPPHHSSNSQHPPQPEDEPDDRNIPAIKKVGRIFSHFPAVQRIFTVLESEDIALDNVLRYWALAYARHATEAVMEILNVYLNETHLGLNVEGSGDVPIIEVWKEDLKFGRRI